MHTNLSLSTLKSVTILYKFCCFLFTNNTGELYPVRPFSIIPNFSNLSISLCTTAFCSSLIGYGCTKNGESSRGCNLTSKYGHVKISSPKLKASHFCFNISTTAILSSEVKTDFDRSILLSINSSSVQSLCGSSLSNHG